MLIANYCDKFKEEYYEQWGTDESEEHSEHAEGGNPRYNGRNHRLQHKAFR